MKTSIMWQIYRGGDVHRGIQHQGSPLLQREAKSSSGWPDVHVFHPLSELTAGSIKDLHSLEGEDHLKLLMFRDLQHTT